MTGKVLGERLRQEKAELKIIYVSDCSTEVFTKDFFLADGVMFLPKPFPAQEFAQTVRDNLDKKPPGKL